MSTTGDVLLPLAAATDVTVAGGKAASLARAVAHGHRVPDGVVVPVDMAAALATGHGAPVAHALNGLVQRLGGVVAVRSSGLAEDGIDASYAGQYETVLDVDSDDDVVDAIGRCVRSADAERLAGYHGRSDRPSMAVLVQRMLRPSAAGVAFSADPVTGDDHVVIEATGGIGEALLAGEITGERWTVDATAAPASERPSILEPDDAVRIAAICRRLASERGRPVDIEWGIEDGDLWLLQVRPITALPVRPADELPQGQTFVREPRVDRPIHPLSFTSWFPLHGDVFAEVFEEFGIPVAAIDHRHHLGRVFSRLTPLMDRGSDGREPPLPVLKLLMHIAPPMRRRIRRAAVWDGDRPIAALIDSWEHTGRDRTRARTAELRGFDLGAASDAELARHLEETQRHLRTTALEHFRLSVGAMAIPMGRLGLFVEERLGWSQAKAFDLVQGSGHASIAHGRGIDELADRLGPDGVDRAIDDPAVLLEDPAGRDYVERFGHVVHIDLADPTEAEDPRLIADHLRRHRAGGSSRRGSDPAAVATAAEASARDALSAGSDVAEFDRLLDLARRGRPLGDETEAVVLTALSPMRAVGLEVGRRWSGTGRLHDPTDVWFLALDELREMLRSPSGPTPDIDRRRREHRWSQAHPAPDHVGPPPPPMLPPSIAGRRYRATLGAALWAFGAMEDQPVEQPDEQHLLHGRPGSPGDATGPARLVRDASDFDRVEPGDIVVCPITTAAWSPIFATIAGLVTDRGGPLSHPATLAREYGLPAVLAVPTATRRIQDGTRLHIDGARGVVEILD